MADSAPLAEAPKGKTPQTFQALGALFRQIHDLPTPTDLDRPDWTADGLVGAEPLWGPFWTHPDLSPAQGQLFLTFRDEARAQLAALTLPSQLIHADPLQENVLVSEGAVALIDFDDCAYGYPLFDLATLLVQRLPDANFADLKAAMIEGYGEVDRQALALLFALRCLTYVGWVQDKRETAAGRAMSGRIVARAVAQTQAYLDGKSPVF